MARTRFSVVTSVYRNDDPEFFRVALQSITIDQTLPPDEVILIVDGPVPGALSDAIKEIAATIPAVKVKWLSENGGLGNALRLGVEMASHDIVARMDSDDIAVPNRFACQMAYLDAHPECDIVGGWQTEFVGDPKNIVGRRVVPLENKDIHNWIKKRCPFNHITVMMRRESVLGVGNYIDWHYNEDYYLWIRMAEKGCRFANLPEVLANVRVGKEMYARRGGWKYFKSEKGLQDYMLSRRLISLPRYLFNVAVRFGVQVAMPNSVRGFIFQKLFRK